MSTEHHYHDWADLVADLIHELTEKNGEIEFDNLVIGVPVSSKPDAPQAPWRLHGKVRIRTNPAKA
ncbi:MAG: hypothetical protein MUE41_07255 [Gemmatimonadaceae bacterium]|jgi:hypothetical protein|nr:hypothetical protein [Gemmatimonadaceae bacterium]